MTGNKVLLPGSERHPMGSRVGAVPDAELIQASIILKPKARIEPLSAGSAPLSREEFSASYGADPQAIKLVESFAHQYHLTVTEVLPERRTVPHSGHCVATSSMA